MAGESPTATQDINSLIASQQGGINPVNLGGTAANIATQTALEGTKAVPIVGSIVAGITIIAGIFAAHHKEAMKKEAQTLNAAFPAWRELINAVANAYNNGSVDATTADQYIDQAVATYYQYVSSIIRNRSSVPPGGERSGQPGHDPCNAACYVAYHFVEPEAYDLRQAIASTEATGQSSTFGLKMLPANKNGLIAGYQSEQITVSKPSPLSTIPGGAAITADVAKVLPSELKPYAGYIALGAAALLVFAIVKR